MIKKKQLGADWKSTIIFETNADNLQTVNAIFIFSWDTIVKFNA